MYLIEILHQTTTSFVLNIFLFRCILSKFYIKPQQNISLPYTPHSCILSKFYIKPQLKLFHFLIAFCCILSKFYIKPQPTALAVIELARCILSKFYIKPQRPLHQGRKRDCCILSKFYIKPQLQIALPLRTAGCILSKFYIKPQHERVRHQNGQVVSYRNSTSNHNIVDKVLPVGQLYLIEILHQTTTNIRFQVSRIGCILSKFYIKPQH